MRLLPPQSAPNCKHILLSSRGRAATRIDSELAAGVGEMAEAFAGTFGAGFTAGKPRARVRMSRALTCRGSGAAEGVAYPRPQLGGDAYGFKDGALGVSIASDATKRAERVGAGGLGVARFGSGGSLVWAGDGPRAR